MAPLLMAASAPAQRPEVKQPRTGAIVEGATLDRRIGTRARLLITPAETAGDDLRLLDDSSKEIPATRAADGTIRADVDLRRTYVLAPRETPQLELPKEGVEFPARYVTFSAEGATRLGGLFLRPARMPLTWSDAARAYATELLVGYEFLDGTERPLAAPRTVTFFAEGANARIQPDTVVVKTSGVPGYQRVTLVTTQVEGETRFTARASAVDEIKASAAILREPGALNLSAPSTLAAFGVGTGTVTVSLLARDGLRLTPAAPLDVRLSSVGLRHPARITLTESTPSVDVDVRSTGMGETGITAETDGLQASRTVRQVFPVAAVVAAIVGGALGGSARYLRNYRRRAPLLLRRIIEGVLVGVMLVASAWAGLVIVDMSTGVLGTPFGAFVLAALGGYLGSVVLDRVAGKTFPPLRAK